MSRINLWSAEILVEYVGTHRVPKHTGVVFASDERPTFDMIRAEYDRPGLHKPLLSGCKLYDLPPFITRVSRINNVPLIQADKDV